MVTGQKGNQIPGERNGFIKMFCLKTVTSDN